MWLNASKYLIPTKTPPKLKCFLVGVGKHTKTCVVPHFPLIWHSRSHSPKTIDFLDENCPSNRANQILDPPIKN